MSNLKYYLALNRMEKVGPRTILKLLSLWPDLSVLFELSAAALEEAGLRPWLAKKISDFDFRQLDDDLSWMQVSGNRIMTWDDADYPQLLREIYDPPMVLYLRGNSHCLQTASLAIVGTRHPSANGRENAFAFAKTLVGHGYQISSGLALGIDAEAHKGALKGGGTTLAVLATGLDRIYPQRHSKLAEEISQNGLLISEFPLKTPPIAGHFPRRNRIISGLSLCTLVVEAAVKSGSLITARYALEQNREVLAIPGSIHNPQARGCHHLIKEGAKLVSSTDDIFEALGYLSDSLPASLHKTGLASSHENLVKCIGFEMTSVDQVVQRSGYAIDRVLCELADLELDGLIKSVPGGYMRC